MPKAFDDMVSAIKKSLRSQYPNLSDKEIESKAYAMATATYKKKYGKSPSEKFMLEYAIPIEFSERVISEGFKDFMISGVAINEVTTLNNHKYIAEELEKAVPSLMNKPLLVDHEQKVENIKGKVIEAEWNNELKRIDFKAKITDEKIKSMIQEGVLNTVSVGAYAKELVEDKDGSMIARGINFAELSLVPCPADQGATFVMAMREAINQESLSMGNIEKIKGGKMEQTLEDNSKVIAELQEKVKVYEAEKRQNLIESYKKLCNEKSVQSLDVSNFSDEVIKSLMEQLKSVKVVTHEKAEVKEEVKDGFILEKSAKGFALYK